MHDVKTSTGDSSDGRPTLDTTPFVIPPAIPGNELPWTQAVLDRHQQIATEGLPPPSPPTAVDGPDANAAAAAAAESDASLAAMPRGKDGGPVSAIPRSRQADQLIDLARSAALFRTPEGEVFADLAVDGHRETWALHGRGFRHWLTRRFLETHRGVPAAQAMQEAMGVLETTALAGAAVRRVHLRVGGLAGKLYLDLGDAAWRAVEIDAAGWRVVAAPPLRFRRPASQRALPVPEAGGSIDGLRGFLNLRSDEDLVMVAAWAFAALRDRGPCPILVLTGEQGSAKSTCTAMLQALIDPTATPPRALPRGDHQLNEAGQAAHLLAFDNLSAVPDWCADALCRRVGGAGAARPVILNGIVDLAVRPDLADRTIVVSLPAIAVSERQPEAALWAAFEAERPRLLGVLLTALVEGLRRAGSVQQRHLPRLADFALWATACETALWPAGTFRAAYDSNRRGTVVDSLEADPLTGALIALMDRQETWEGTASLLLEVLRPLFEGHNAGRGLPGNPRALAGRVRQLAAFLRPLGYEVSFGRHVATRARLIMLSTNPAARRARTAGDGAAAEEARPQDAAPTATTPADRPVAVG